jgi:hypothetical protein
MQQGGERIDEDRQQKCNPPIAATTPTILVCSSDVRPAGWADA